MADMTLSGPHQMAVCASLTQALPKISATSRAGRTRPCLRGPPLQDLTTSPEPPCDLGYSAVADFCPQDRITRMSTFCSSRWVA